MEQVLITKKRIRHTKAGRLAKKSAKLRYKRVRGDIMLHARIPKAVRLVSEEAEYIGTTAEEPGLDNIPHTKEDVCNVIMSVKLKGFSGGGVPLIDKLLELSRSESTSYSLIVNAAECDPGLLHDEWLLVHRRNEILNGIGLLAKCLSFKDIIVATKLPISSETGKIRIVQVPDRYPIGEEHILSEYVLKRKVHKELHPAEQGILVSNVQTIYQLYLAVCNKTPSTKRYLTACNLMTGEAKVLCVPLQTEAGPLLTTVFGPKPEGYAFIGGGLLYSHPLQPHEKITEETGLICYADTKDLFPDTACKGCGSCEKNCVMHIKIKELVKTIEKKQAIAREAFQLDSCIKCGACSYFCRAGKDLRHLVCSLTDPIS